MSQSMGPPQSEEAFRKFYAPLAAKWGIDPDPDNPSHHYDYRAAFNAGASPDATGHWPSEFKDESHPRRFMLARDGRVIDTVTGKVAPQGTKPGFTEGEPSMSDRLRTDMRKRSR